MKNLTVLLICAATLLPASARAQLLTEYEPVRDACCLSLTIRNIADQLQDWNQLSHYYGSNQELRKSPPDPKRVVFMGDSITDNWRLAESFPGQPYVNRGIGGQTTPQMVGRMFPDVIAVKPAAVVILAGTNDISRATGASTAEMIEFNLMAMTQLARANDIKVILCSILPTDDTPTPTSAPLNAGRGGAPQPPAGAGRGFAPRRKNSEMRPPADIVLLNTWIREYARKLDIPFVDYHAALVGADGMLRDGLSNDGVHPNEAGYAVMAPLVQSALRRVLR